MQKLNLELLLYSILATLLSALVGFGLISAVGYWTSSPFVMIPLVFATIFLTMVIIAFIRGKVIDKRMKN